MDKLNESARSVEYQEQVVKTLQSKISAKAYKSFVKALVNELYLGNDINNRENFLDDLMDCLKVTTSDDVQDYWKLDTVVRDHFMTAYDNTPINSCFNDAIANILNGVPIREALNDAGYGSFGNFKEGTIKINGKTYFYSVKVFDKGSQFGIDGGRISKLSITLDDNFVVNYDRGWDIKPNKSDKDLMLVYNQVLDQFN